MGSVFVCVCEGGGATCTNDRIFWSINYNKCLLLYHVLTHICGFVKGDCFGGQSLIKSG